MHLSCPTSFETLIAVLASRYPRDKARLRAQPRTVVALVRRKEGGPSGSRVDLRPRYLLLYSCITFFRVETKPLFVSPYTPRRPALPFDSLSLCLDEWLLLEILPRFLLFIYAHIYIYIYACTFGKWKDHRIFFLEWIFFLLLSCTRGGFRSRRRHGLMNSVSRRWYFSVSGASFCHLYGRP